MHLRILSLAALGVAIAGVVIACVGDSPTTTIEPGTDSGASTTNDSSSSPIDAATLDAPPPPTCDGGNVCSGACVNLQTDNANCGACSASCATNDCFEGACAGHKIVDISAGHTTACVVFASGHVACWGAGEYGELGVDPSTLGLFDGTPGRSSAAEIPGITDATQVSVGKYSVCARTKSNDAYCWGWNDVAALGHAAGSGTDQVCNGVPCNWVPSKVSGITSPVVEVREGERNGCVRTADNKVFCWGYDGWFANGQGNTTENDLSSAAVVPGLPNDLNSLSVSTNASHVCVTSNAALYCWGANLSGELGHLPGQGSPADIAAPSSASFFANSTPQEVTGFSLPTQVVTAQGLTCELSSGHQAACVGTNVDGELGAASADGGNTYAFSTVNLANVETLAAGFISGDDPVCALNLTQEAFCWGNASLGQAGTGYWSGLDAGAYSGLSANCGNGSCYTSPVAVPAYSFAKIAAGSGFVVGLASDGHVYGWGYNAFGATGHDPGNNGDQTCINANRNGACAPSPVRIMSLP